MYVESWMAVIAAVMGAASVACVVATAHLDHKALAERAPRRTPQD